jgi:hypothetical protein
MTRPAVFTQGDISKLLKGARSAGYSVSRVEIDPTGKIVAQLGEGGAPSLENGDDEWGSAISAKKERTAQKRN